jgi:hypothetical protein
LHKEPVRGHDAQSLRCHATAQRSFSEAVSLQVEEEDEDLAGDLKRSKFQAGGKTANRAVKAEGGPGIGCLTLEGKHAPKEGQGSGESLLAALLLGQQEFYQFKQFRILV